MSTRHCLFNVINTLLIITISHIQCVKTLDRFGVPQKGNPHKSISHIQCIKTVVSFGVLQKGNPRNSVLHI